MRAFNGGAELRLTHDDLRELLEDALNRKIFGVGLDQHSVVALSLTPKNKYVVSCTLKPTKPHTAKE